MKPRLVALADVNIVDGLPLKYDGPVLLGIRQPSQGTFVRKR